MVVKKRLQYLNTDDTRTELGAEDALNIVSCRSALSLDGADRRIENIPSTLLINNSYLPSTGVNITIGSTYDANKRRMYFFNYNSASYHGIYCYDFTVQAYYVVILNAQVSGGLNFSLSNCIDRNCYVIDNLLYWTDNLNEPRKINVELAISANTSGYSSNAYSFPLDYTSITLIKKPPINVLTGSKFQDTGTLTNFILATPFQFAYFFEYNDYEISALSAFSVLFPVNAKLDLSNCINLKVPFAETILQDVQKINIVARFGNSGKTTIVQTWDKANSSDLTAINNHNSGSAQLSYNFYNNINGTALDDVSANTSFDNVPLLVKTIALAKNRFFHGNVLQGYDTPATTSLSVSQNASSGGIYPSNFFTPGSSWNVSIAFMDRFRRKSGVVKKYVSTSTPELTYSGAAVSNTCQSLAWALSNTNALNEIPSWAYYYQIHITKNQTKQSFLQCFYNDCCYVMKDQNGVLDFTQTVYDASRTYAVGVDISNLTAAGLGYTYNVGDVAVVHTNTGTNYTLQVIGQSGNYVLLQPQNIGSISNSFKWDFQQLPVINYVTYTLPMTLRDKYTNTGIAAQSTNFADLGSPWVNNNNWSINITDGSARIVYLSGNITLIAGATYPSDYMKIAAMITGPGMAETEIDLATQNGVTIGTAYYLTWNRAITMPAGYTKMMIVYLSSRGEIYPSISDGYLGISQSADLNVLDIYTPYKSSQTYEPFYECSPVYAVSNPTTNSRAYSNLSGTILGDLYGVSRNILYTTTTYSCAAMSPNDLYWMDWERNLGWVNQIDNIGQRALQAQISFTDTYITGSKSNGLNKFQALNYKNIGNTSGAIQKLILTNKKQEDGTVLLCITQEEPLSIYLGETQVVASSQNAYMAQSNDVIGTVNALKGSYGTLHPESVIDFKGEVYWWCIMRASWIQYSVNGAIPIDYKCAKYFKKVGIRYQQQGLTSRMVSCIDPVRYHLIGCIPSTETTSYPYTLPSYSGCPSYATTIKSQFELYDGQAKMMFFDAKENRWKYNIPIIPEWMDYVENMFFGFLNGQMYQLEAGSGYNSFFGTSIPARVAFTITELPSVIKDLYNIELEGNSIPDFTVGFSDYPYNQITDLAATDTDMAGNTIWQDNEGIKQADFLKDRESPNVSGTVIDKLFQGDWVKSVTPLIMVEFQQYTNKMWLIFLNIGFGVSRNHTETNK